MAENANDHSMLQVVIPSRESVTIEKHGSSRMTRRPLFTRSIRGRLHVWYGAVYTLSIIVFGSLVYWRADREVRDRAVLQAEAAVHYLDGRLVSMRVPETVRPGDSDLPRADIFVRPGFPPEAFRPERSPEEIDHAPGDPNAFPPRRRTRDDHIPDLLPPEMQFAPPGRRPVEPRRQFRQEPPGMREPRDRISTDPSRGPPPPVKERPGGPAERFRPPREPDGEFERNESLEFRAKQPALDRLEYVVWRRDGTVFATSRGFTEDDILPMPGLPLDASVPRVSIMPDRVEILKRGPGATLISVVRPLQHDLDDLRRFGVQTATLATITLILGFVGGWWLSEKMVEPIQQISRTASQISASSLDRRIELDHLDQELVMMAEVLNQTFGRLQHSFARLTQFTADASHELRTPLAVIQSQAELALSQPRTPEAYRETLQTCLKSAERMSGLIDGLLLLARADSERLHLRFGPVDLRRVAEEAVNALAHKAESADVSLTCITPETAVYVDADSRFLMQVPFNLIDNAILHSDPGRTVSITVRTDSGRAELSVADTGCGISREHLPHVFERFYRVDKSRSRNRGGSGLGLAICRELAEIHSGTLTCESSPGAGSTFTLRLPLSPASTTG